MLNRIIYCALGCVSLLGAVPHKALLHLDSDIVASIPDEALTNLLLREPLLPILYFSPADYESATINLQGQAKEDVVRRRLNFWSPQVLDQALNWVYRRERTCLALTSALKQKSSGETARVLDEHSRRTLDLLTQIISEGRYDDLDLTSLLVLTVEGEAKLLSELSLSANSNEAELRKRFALALATELKQRGRPEFAQALPYPGVMRGVFISPADKPLKSYLISMQEPFFEWRDGIVVRWSADKLAEIQKQGKTAKILYYNGGELLERAGELTDLQLRREFEARAKAEKQEVAKQIGEYLNSLRLEQTLLRHATRVRAKKENPNIAALLDQQIDQELPVFFAEISKHGSWLPDQGQTVSIESLQEYERGLIEDLMFFEALCRFRVETDLERRIKNILQTKKTDLARITF